MKIAVTATENIMDAQMDPRFGRCSYFVVVDTDNMNFEAIKNDNKSAGGGAGIQSAVLLTQKDVKAVLTGNCGPNAFRVLNEAGIDVIVGVEGTIKEAVQKFKEGKVTVASGASTKSHSGLN